jgi:hypothetical protein
MQWFEEVDLQALMTGAIAGRRPFVMPELRPFPNRSTLRRRIVVAAGAAQGSDPAGTRADNAALRAADDPTMCDDPHGRVDGSAPMEPGPRLFSAVNLGAAFIVVGAPANAPRVPAGGRSGCRSHS